MIEVENLSKTYVSEPVVRDLSFFVPEGQVLGFLGPNGAGKTTVMRMLTAFLPPTTGRVVVAGVDLDQDPVGLQAQRRLSAGKRTALSRAAGRRVPPLPRRDRGRRQSRGPLANRPGDRPLPARRCAAPGDRHPVQGLPPAGGSGRGADPRTGGVDPRRAHGRSRPQPDHQGARAHHRARPRTHGAVVDPHPARGGTGLRAGLHHRPRAHRRRRHAGRPARQAGRQPVVVGGAQGGGTTRPRRR